MEAIFRIFFPVFASGGSGLAEGDGAYRKKKGGVTSFRIPEIFRKFFFVPAADWLQQSDFNTRALTHTQIQTHTHRASDWRLAVGILADEGVQTRRMLAGDQLRLSAAHPDGPRDDSLCAQECVPRVFAFALCPVWGSAQEEQSENSDVPTHNLPQPLSLLFIYFC